MRKFASHARSIRAPITPSSSQQPLALRDATRRMVEQLEGRRLLSIATVNSNADTDARDSALTLREAIEYINGTLSYASLSTLEQAQIDLTQPLGASDAIKFNIAGSGLQTVYPTSPLPAITKAVTIDGYSQPGASPAHVITIGGANGDHPFEIPATFTVALDGVYTSAASGLAIEAPSVTIDGLMIYRFTGNASGTGISLEAGSGNDSIWGNYVGTDGTRNLGNDTGISVSAGSSNNTIGGTTIDKRNVISGNYENAGINIVGNPFDPSQVTGNVIEGNYIGTDATGSTAIANREGISMSRTSSNTIGGLTPGAGNLISGNTYDGISLNYYGNGTAIEGNYIGVTASGLAALGNGGEGISSTVAHGTTVGAAVAGGGNVISGNGSDGIFITSDGSAVIVNNRVGTNALGTAAIANKGDGILISDDFYITIGGTGVNTANVISGNGTNGIELSDTGSATIQGNYIGTDPTGDVGDITGDGLLGNTLAGVLIDNDSYGNTVGGTTTAARNIISANGAAGVQIDGGDPTEGGSTSGNIVEGNYIGLDASGQFGLGDGDAGVLLDLGAMNNTIGGTAPGAGNVISGIIGAGVYIAGIHTDYSGGSGIPTLSTANTVQGNFIGTDATGTKRVSTAYVGTPPYFAGNGIVLDSFTYNNLIGGTTAAARNVIAGNSADGIYIDDQTGGNTIQGNYVGVDVTGVKALGNGADGILLNNTGGNTIGGTSAGAGNVISGNLANGIHFSQGSGSVVQGNQIGTDATGLIALGNAGAGLYLEYSSADNSIGGNFAAAGNVIANNGGAGVAIKNHSGSGGTSNDASTGDTIRFNSIYANTGLGIDLENDGVTANDPQDTDTGGNDLQNFPVLVTATATGSSVTVAGTVNSRPGTNFTLDFYANSTVDSHGFGQGKQYLGSVGVITDSFGNATFNSTFNVAIGSNPYITATATNASTAPYSDTSEFSQAVQATAGTGGSGGTGTGGGTTTPPVLPSVSINDVKQNEGNGGATAFTFTVTRSGDLTSASTVVYSTTDGTATAGSDYAATSGTVSFAANQSTATVTVNVNGDTTVEPDETFYVNLATPTNATIADGQGIGTIVNDDVTPPPSVSIGDVSQAEGNSGTTAYTFTLTRTGDLTNSSIVSVSTTDGTATAGSDYTALNGTLVAIAANQSTATVTVNVNGDTTVEANETFNVNVTAVTNATIGDGQGVGTIVNDDLPPTVSINSVALNEGNSGTTAFTFTLTRTGDLTNASVVSVSTTDGTATAGSDYAALAGTLVAFAANQATATVTVNVTGDTTVESNETFAVALASTSNATIDATHGSGTGTIVNDDVIVPPPTPVQLGGTAFGTAGSFLNRGNTIANVFDGKLATFFDGPTANGDVVGFDFGSAQTITSIQYAPRSGFASRMLGGVIQASNTADFASLVTLLKINATPAIGSLTSAAVSNAGAYRYVRYVAPNGSFGNVAELQFFGTPGTTTTTTPPVVTLPTPPVTTPTKLTGTTIGTAGSFLNNGNTIAKATDGDLSTFFDGPTSNGNSVGLDLGVSKVIKQIAYAPRNGYASRMVGGIFQGSNSADFSNAATLLSIIATPSQSLLTMVTISNATAYRYVRYLAPAASYGDVGEIAFYG